MFEIQYVDIPEKKEYESIIKKVLKECFKIENLTNSKMIINVILTTSENIKKYNKEYRNIDKETDVLSFPMFEKEEIEEKVKNNDFKTMDILGDMIISIPRVEEQAIEYVKTLHKYSFVLKPGTHLFAKYSLTNSTATTTYSFTNIAAIGGSPIRKREKRIRRRKKRRWDRKFSAGY